MSDKVRVVRCPSCGQSVRWHADSTWRPFCSARCRQVNLGAWASEAYRVPSSPPDALLDDIDFQPPGLGEGRRR